MIVPITPADLVQRIRGCMRLADSRLKAACLGVAMTLRLRGVPATRVTVAVLAVASWLGAAGSALAVSLGDMAKEAADDLESVPALLAIAFYIIGAAIVGFGLLKLKRHVDHPQQTTIGSGLIAILIGVALIAAPAIINALGDTLGLGGGSHTVIKPRL